MSNQNSQNVVSLGKFNGMLAGFALSAYNTVFVCGIPRKVAHKVANDFASALGRAIKEDSEMATKVAKAKKSGEMKITGKLEASFKDDSASIVRACQILGSLVSEKLTTKYPQINQASLDRDLVNYLETCEKWASATVFDIDKVTHNEGKAESEAVESLAAQA